MERHIPAAEMDARFDEIMGYADAGDTVFLTVDEKPDTVLMSVGSYLDRFRPLLSDEKKAFLQKEHHVEGSE